MGITAMCDCVRCRARVPEGPPAKDNGRGGEHLCPYCLKTPICRDDPRNNPTEDLPEVSVS